MVSQWIISVCFDHVTILFLVGQNGQLKTSNVFVRVPAVMALQLLKEDAAGRVLINGSLSTIKN